MASAASPAPSAGQRRPTRACSQLLREWPTELSNTAVIERRVRAMPSGAATSERASRTTTSEHGAVTTQTGRKLSSHSLFRSPGKKIPSNHGRFRDRVPVSKTGLRANVSGVRIPPSPFVCLLVCLVREAISQRAGRRFPSAHDGRPAGRRASTQARANIFTPSIPSA